MEYEYTLKEFISKWNINEYDELLIYIFEGKIRSVLIYETKYCRHGYEHCGSNYVNINDLKHYDINDNEDVVITYRKDSANIKIERGEDLENVSFYEFKNK